MTSEPAGSPPKPYPWLQTNFAESTAQFSPDGRWVVWQSDETGRLEVYVAPFSGAGGKRQVSAEGGNSPRWRRDGRELFYRGPDGKLTAVEVGAKGTTLELGKSSKLPVPASTSGLLGFTYDVAADGQRFLAIAPVEQAGRQELTVVLNWAAGLKK